MIKVIDIDALFDAYVSDYVYKNIGKVKPEEIENKIPEFYLEFGNTPLKELDGKSPNEYYNDFSVIELLKALKEHLNSGVNVSDFLCESLQNVSDPNGEIEKALKEDDLEEYTIYLLNVISQRQKVNNPKALLDFILWDYSDTIKELATEILVENADAVKEDILAQYNTATKSTVSYFTEILSHTTKDDRVFAILVAEFINNPKDIPIYANYLVHYGDERAIEVLKTAIENENISYADFEELRFSIEALGGEYDKKRDFSI